RRRAEGPRSRAGPRRVRDRGDRVLRAARAVRTRRGRRLHRARRLPARGARPRLDRRRPHRPWPSRRPDGPRPDLGDDPPTARRTGQAPGARRQAEERALPHDGRRQRLRDPPAPARVARRRRVFELTYTPEEEAFRAELRAWLRTNVPGEPPPEDEDARRV